MTQAGQRSGFGVRRRIRKWNRRVRILAILLRKVAWMDLLECYTLNHDQRASFKVLGHPKPVGSFGSPLA